MFGRLMIFAGADTIAARILTGESYLTVALALLATAALVLWLAAMPERSSRTGS